MYEEDTTASVSVALSDSFCVSCSRHSPKCNTFQPLLEAILQSLVALDERGRRSTKPWNLVSLTVAVPHQPQARGNVQKASFEEAPRDRQPDNPAKPNLWTSLPYLHPTASLFDLLLSFQQPKNNCIRDRTHQLPHLPNNLNHTPPFRVLPHLQDPPYSATSSKTLATRSHEPVRAGPISFPA